MEIKRHDGSVIGDWPAETIRGAVEAAVRAGANLSRADLSGAYLRGADLSRADLSGAYLRGADLSGASLAWTSHALLSEILWRAADTESRRMLAAYVGRMMDRCWSKWRTWEHPEREWALAELRKWVKPDDGSPEWLTAGK